MSLDRSHAALGLLNGLLIGLALALGLWVREALALVGVPAAMDASSMMVAGLLVVAISGVAGWLSAKVHRAGITILLWLVAALAITFVAAYRGFAIRTSLIWISDPRAFGLPIYPFVADRIAGVVVGGIFIMLALAAMALLQDYRLENIEYERDEQSGRLIGAGWWQLAWPLPLVMGAGLATSAVFGGLTSPRAMQLVHLAIETAQSYEGDLFQLGREEGINYSAVNPVREQIGGDYRLSLVEINPDTSTTIVVAHFENGAWVYCRVINDQLNFCYDASPPYTMGLLSLLTGAAVPEDCRNCLPAVSDDLRVWLRARGQHVEGTPRVERLAQWGSYVIMGVESEEGDFAIECRFHGVQPVTLEACREVERA